MLTQKFACSVDIALTAEVEQLAMFFVSAGFSVGQVKLQAGIPFPAVIYVADNWKENAGDRHVSKEIEWNCQFNLPQVATCPSLRSSVSNLRKMDSA